MRGKLGTIINAKRRASPVRSGSSNCTSFVILYRYCKRVADIRSACGAGIAREQAEGENRKRLKIKGGFVSKSLVCVDELAAGTIEKQETPNIHDQVRLFQQSE